MNLFRTDAPFSALAALHAAISVCEALGVVTPGQALRIKLVLREGERHVQVPERDR